MNDPREVPFFQESGIERYTKGGDLTIRFIEKGTVRETARSIFRYFLLKESLLTFLEDTNLTTDPFSRKRVICTKK